MFKIKTKSIVVIFTFGTFSFQTLNHVSVNAFNYTCTYSYQDLIANLRGSNLKQTF